jgi:hypothetical protein
VAFHFPHWFLRHDRLASPEHRSILFRGADFALSRAVLSSFNTLDEPAICWYN